MVQLDALRAFAVLAVLLQHTLDIPPTWKCGRLGVRLFYVLSGYLITGILLRARDRCSGASDSGHVLRAFYARRSLRIFPLYYLVLGVAAAFALPGVSEYLFSCITYTTNFRSALDGTFLPMPIGHFWSLAVEEQFYLCWPLLVLLLPPRWLPAAITATLVVGPVSRLLLFRFGGGVAWEAAPTSCLDTLGAGALLAYCSTPGGLSPGARRGLRLSLLGGMALSALIVFWRLTGRMHTPSVVLEDAAYALLFGWLVGRAAEGFGGWAKVLLEFRPLVYLGTISYGVYVYHNFVPVAGAVVRERLGIEPGMPDGNGLGLFVYVSALTIGVAALSWHVFEKPVNRLKDYFPYLKPTKGTREERAETVASPCGAKTQVLPVPALPS
jgi:peptidoglycan/LPS O-acetylase OafA/YrhL